MMFFGQNVVVPGVRPTTINRWLDGLLAVFCLVAGAMLAYALSQRLDAQIYADNANNVWFQADLQRTFSNMVDTNGEHYRTKVHPIASLVTITLTSLVRTVWPSNLLDAALRFEALAAGLWAAGLYLLYRQLAGGRIAALAFAGLGVSSAAFMFWFSVAETYGLGSLTILLVLLLAARSANETPSSRTLFAANAVSLSMTVTNWMVGLAFTFSSLPWRKAVRIAFTAVAFIALLALIQKLLIPSSKLFFLGSREELMYVNRQESGGIFEKLAALLLHGFAMPQIDVKAVGQGSLAMLSVQFARPSSGSVYGIPALLLWGCLLGIGIWGAFRVKGRVVLVRVIAITIAGQVVLHLLYGEETFLYALNLMPVLIALAMLGRFAPCGIVAPWIAVAAMTFGFANNLAAFSAASESISTSVLQRDQSRRSLPQRLTTTVPDGQNSVMLHETPSRK